MSRADFKLPMIYSWFFLILEPISAIIGAYYANFQPLKYLQLTHSASTPYFTSSIPLSTQIVLKQLANLYLLFAINEACVLRSTPNIKVWRTVLFGLLIADFGHLYSVSALGWDIYWDVLAWNRMAWGNVGFVYLGVVMRISFLSGLGLGTKRAQAAAARAKKS